MLGKIWIDGGVVDAAEARLPVLDRGLLHGDSVFEVLRTFGGRPFALTEHLDRLARSASVLRMPVPARPELCAALEATLGALLDDGVADAWLRVLVTRGVGGAGLDASPAGPSRLVIIALPLKLPDATLYETGASAILLDSSYGLSVGGVLPSVKSGNCLRGVLATMAARDADAHEALLSDTLGRVIEGASSNVFIVRSGRVTTPPVALGLLAGITRRYVMRLSRGLAIGVDQATLWPLDVRGADEVFITSSIRGVMPVSRIDGQAVGDGRPGPITRRIASAYLVDAAHLAATN